MDFHQQLKARQQQLPDASWRSFCLGIDPSAENFSTPFLQEEMQRLGHEAFLERWTNELLSVASKHVAAVKFQAAFFEIFGEAGLRVLKKSLAAAKKLNLITILDAKRSDIGSTMAAYGQAAFDELAADALTVVPYFGLAVMEALAPWLRRGKGIYVVLVSSNKEGELIQQAPLTSGQPLHTLLLEEFERYAGEQQLLGSLGYVLGATSMGKVDMTLWGKRLHALLLPGVGAQGAAVDKPLEALLASHPQSLVPISRGATRPLSHKPFKTWDSFQVFVEKQLQLLVKGSAAEN